MRVNNLPLPYEYRAYKIVKNGNREIRITYYFNITTGTIVNNILAIIKFRKCF